jgi:hypothetical protein
MHEEPTTVIQRYLDALPGDKAAEPIVQRLMEQAVGRLRLLCRTFMYKSGTPCTPTWGALAEVGGVADYLAGGMVPRFPKPGNPPPPDLPRWDDPP